MKTTIVNVHWGYSKDPNSVFENFATIEVSHYGEQPKDTTIKRELKAIGLATKPIKHVRFIVK